MQQRFLVYVLFDAQLQEYEPPLTILQANVISGCSDLAYAVPHCEQISANVAGFLLEKDDKPGTHESLSYIASILSLIHAWLHSCNQ